MAYSASTFQNKLITLASKKTTFAFISPALIEIYQPSGFGIGSQDAKKHSLFPMLPSSRRPRKIGISGKSAFLLKLWDPSCLVKASYLKPVNTICTFEVFKGLLLVIFIFDGIRKKRPKSWRTSAFHIMNLHDYDIYTHVCHTNMCIFLYSYVYLYSSCTYTYIYIVHCVWLDTHNP